MIEIDGNELVVRFPEVHETATLHVNFQRTLRIPDDNAAYPLPPGLGRFPLAHVDDHAVNLPPKWSSHGGVFLPMYQAEALWICFSASGSRNGVQYPFAVKIAAGKINAVSGESWSNALRTDIQDYLVVPDQPWIDGFCVGKGLIRQFVAMPMGDGYTAEEQITGLSEHGGLQLIIYPMKRRIYDLLVAQTKHRDDVLACDSMASPTMLEMGLAPGGLMRQQIHPDVYGIDAWETDHSSRCFVHILNTTQWNKATGQPMPTSPVTAEEYENAGLPWFDYYLDDVTSLPGGSTLKGLDGIAAKHVKLGYGLLQENETITTKTVIQIGKSGTEAKMEKGDQFPAEGEVQSIEINNDSVATAFEIIVEEIEQVADEIDAQGAEHFKRSDHEAVRNALELAGKLITFKTKLSALQDEWSRTIDVSLRRRIEIGTAGGTITAGGNPKGPKTALRVTFADGKMIREATAALTFARVLQRIGFDEVGRQGRKLNGFPLISKEKCPPPYIQTQVESYLVMTHCNTPCKKRLLDKIAITAGITINVEIID